MDVQSDNSTDIQSDNSTPVNEKVTLNDHDLLVVLHTQMQRVLMDIREVKDNTVARIMTLENSVVYRKEADALATDFETRIRSLEKTQVQIMTWGAAGVLAIGIVEFLVIHFLK